MFALLRRTVVILIGFCLIVVFIWFAGPYFQFASWKPLEPPINRLITIGVIVGCWLVVKAVKRLNAYRKSDRFLAAVAAQPQPEPARTPAEVQKLRDRFDEAVTALKTQRRSGHSLYDLPWYVIIGAPGSGKTTALLNSGLTFPLEQRVGKGALRGVGGTRNCDWWFTDEAIFLDTAGRYTTQDSDAASDSLGWSEFLALLRKYRARRPINGVILTISAHDLIVEGAASREAHVDAAQRRLEELNRELGIQLPVYLMVTKCDLVDGFAEYFEEQTAQGRAQVWGVTFPYDQTLSNESPQAYPAEFDELMTRLNERVFERIEEVRDTRRRAKVFAFPQQMAAIRNALTEFVTEVFGSRQFAGRILLRGVYFTSGTQEGTPIDRLLGSIGRSFGASAALRPPSGPGKAYFVESLLKDVMIGESGLAGINRRLEGRKAAAQLGTYVAAGLVAAVGVLALSLSYNRNRDFLEHTGAQVEALERFPPQPANASIDRIVPRLDAIRGVVDSTDQYRDNTTWMMRWGLYQGRSIGTAARDAYLRELDTVLLPRVHALFRTRMTQFGAQPERLYPYLKGYLMLGYPENLNRGEITKLAEQEWTGARGAPSANAAALSKHFQNLLESGDPRALPLDVTLVAQARSVLGPSSMPRMLYSSIKAKGSDADGLRLDQRIGTDLERIFKRRSGASFSTPVPRLFTPEVFRQFTGEGKLALITELTKDGWVWGETLTSSLTSAGAVVTGVIALYEEDYIRTWDGVLNDLEFTPTRTIEETRETYRILTSQSSPLRSFVRLVGDNTALAPPPPAAKGPESVFDKAKGGINATIDKVLNPTAPVGAPTVEPGRAVSAQFQWVRQLTAGEPGKTQLDLVINRLGEILALLDTLGPDIAGRNVQELLMSPQFRSLMQGVKQQAEEVPRPLNAVLLAIAKAPEDIIRVDASNQLDRFYDLEVLAQCRTHLTGRYPFGGLTQPDVQMVDFGSVFGYDGVFDRFFTKYLKDQVDTAQSPWTWRPGAARSQRPMLQQFHDAQVVRDMFFPAGSKTPKVEFAVTISDLDPGSNRFVLTLDGQMMGANPRESVKAPGVVWPGQVPGRTEASFDVRYFEPPIRYPGAWGWFRMIDTTREGAPDAQQPVRLKVQTQSNRQVRVTVEAARASSNPFASQEWRQFKCEL